MDFNAGEIVKEWSYGTATGMPDFTSSYDLVVLEQLLIEKNYRRKFIEALLSTLRERGVTDFPAVSKTGRTVYFGTKDKQRAAISTGTHSKLGSPEPKKAEKTRKKVTVKKSAKKAKVAVAKKTKEKQEKEKQKAIKAWLDSVPDVIKDDEELVRQVTRTIANRSIEKTFVEDMFTQNNITDRTVDTANAPEVFLNILSKNDDLQNYDKYEQPSFADLGQTGNLIDDHFSKSNMKYETLQQMLSLSGKESGRGVGKGEMGLATLLSDVKMAEAGAGDLDWNGKYLEVKGSGARLGGRDRPYPGTFEESALGKIAAKYNNSDRMVARLISNLASQPDIDKEQLLSAVREFENISHPDGNSEKYFTIDILDDPAKLRAAFTKNLIQHYAAQHGIDHFIWLNTNETIIKSKDGQRVSERNPNFGNYVSFTLEEADDLVDEGIIQTNNIGIHQLDPAISKP